MVHNKRCRVSGATQFPSESFTTLFDQDFVDLFDGPSASFNADWIGEDQFADPELDSLAILETSRPADFTDGSVIVMFGKDDAPALAVAIREMPEDAHEPVDWVIRSACQRFSVSSVLLGQYRSTDSLGSSEYVDVEYSQLEAWCRIAAFLAEEGIALRNIFVCEPQSWASVASYFARSTGRLPD